MPDKKQYLIEIPGMEGADVWDADRWAKNKEDLLKDHKDANVFEVDAYNPEEEGENDQYMISLPQMEGNDVWDADRWAKNKEDLLADHPDAIVQRIRYVDYWGQQAEANRARKAELQQPDTERNARLADLGYYDDMSDQQKDFSLENNTVGLKPVSSAIEQNSVSGEITYHDPKLADFYANDSVHNERMAEVARLDEEYESNPSIIAQRQYEEERRQNANRILQEAEEAYKNIDHVAVSRYHRAFEGSPTSAKTLAKGIEDAAKDDQIAMAFTMLKEAETLREGVHEGGLKGFGKNLILPSTLDGEDYKRGQQALLKTFLKLQDTMGPIDQWSEEKMAEVLTKEEKLMVDSFFELASAQSDTEGKFSEGYDAGRAFAHSVPFMIDFMISSGMSDMAAKPLAEGLTKAAAKKLAKKAGESLAKRAVKTGLRQASRLGIGILQSAVSAAVQTPVQSGTSSAIMDAMLQFDEETGKLKTDAKTIATAYFDRVIENFSEGMGEVLGGASKTILGGTGRALNKAFKTTAFTRLGGAFGKTTIGKLGKAAGIQNGLFEMAEEAIGSAIRDITIDKGAWEEFADSRNLLVTALSFLPTTILGGSLSLGQIGAAKLSMERSESKMQKELSGYVTPEQMSYIVNTATSTSAEGLVETMKPILVGMQLNGASKKQVNAVRDYMVNTARYQTLMGAEETNANEQRKATGEKLEQEYGKFYYAPVAQGKSGQQMELSPVVRTARLKNGRDVYIVSNSNEMGEFLTIDMESKKKGTAKESDIAEQLDNSGKVQKLTMTESLNDFLSRRVMLETKETEAARMKREYQEQVDAIRSEIKEGTEINLGTEGSPIILLANGKTSDAGVDAIDQNGVTHTIGWEQTADALGKPIIVLTDAQIVEKEIADIVARDAERKAQRAQEKGRDEIGAAEAVTEADETISAVDAQTKHIPMNEDGTVNEAAFWEQDPEGYAQWNDEQNQDGGADTIQQIEAAKAELTAMLEEAQRATATSNPANRKAAKREVDRLAQKLGRIEALEKSYAEKALAPFRERAKMWADMTHSNIHVLETEEELAAISDQTAAENAKPGARVRGFAKNGRAYIYLPGIKDIKEIDEVFFHEAVAHNGLKGYLGQERFDKLCESVWSMMSQAARNKFINYPGVNGNHLAAADEYIAHIAEKIGAGIAEEEEKTIWQMIVDWVQNALRDMGIEIEFTEQELSDLLHKAYADLGNNMAKAEQIAKGEAMSAVEEAPSEARQQYDALLADLTPEEIEAVAENDFNAAQEAYNSHVANAPRVEPGESSKAYIERKKAYNDELKRLEAELNAQQALMGEIAAIKAANAPVPTDAEILQQDGFGVDEQHDDVRMSVRYTPTDEQKEAIINSIVNVTGRTRGDAEKWLASETSLAAIINDDLQYLDYVADPKYKAIKDNSDYPQGTVDFNNICRKRVPFTRMFTRLQRAFPNRVFTADELADIRTIMSKDGLTVACGLCYVEDRRQMVGEVAQSFIDGIQEGFETYANNPTKQKNAEKFKALIGDDTYVPQVYDLTTQEGLDKLYNEHRGVWEAFQAFNNARGQQSQNLLQGYAEYKREILSWSDKKVKQVNDNGGLRIFSYSDFEAHHLIDVVQIIIDCASKGVKIQGYTKVPAFARAVANTGIKLNRSLIPLGDTGLVDGQLAFDPVEGIDINDSDFLESNDNVGNILIGINDEQIRVAMNDARIHYIIPYHARQKENIRQKLNVGAWTNYISTQNERNISDGKRVKDNINIYTDILTEDITTDKQFVEKYLQLCAEQGRIPKFDQFLDKDAEGNYVYTPGYYKFLIDFKLFDENGNILPQQPVVAEFDDAFNMQILEDYAKNEKESTGDQMNETYDKIVKTIGLDESMAEGEDVRFSTVKEITDKFNAELQQQIEGTLPAGHVYQLGMPSAILVSAGIPSLPIEITSRRLKEKSQQENHIYELSEVMNLPRVIHNPLAVFRSATHLDSNVILTELRHGGKNFVAAIETNRVKGRIVVNDIRSVHPRTTTNIIDWINENLMDYADKENMLTWINEKIKSRDYLNSSKPAEVRKTLDSAAKVVKEFVNPSIAAENEDTRLSIRTDEQREQLFDAAKKEFGTTNNFNVAGYMLPDGSLLDFSEEGAPANQRTLDHREIEGIIMDEGREYDNRWQYLADFMNEGAIRLLPEYAGINLMHAPTAEQRKRLFDFIYKYNGEVILEIADDRLNNVAYVEYDRRTSPARIFRDIDSYFQSGIAPQQNTMFSVVTPEQDAAYMEAVMSGDLETAQRMVNEAAKRAMPNTKVVDENGNPLIVYHGTSYKGYVFNQGFFAKDEDFARDYTLFNKPEDRRLVSAFLNIENPRTIDANYSNYDSIDTGRIITTTDYLVDETREEGIHDGLIVKNVDERSLDGNYWTDDYIPFSPSQIKSADPVTYDDAGNVIPLSERFNLENSDIRFSLQEEGQSSEDFHNAVLDDFKKQFNVIAPTTVVRVEDRAALAEAIGVTAEDLTDDMYQKFVDGVDRGGAAFYADKTNRIVIFALDRQTRSAEIDDNIFHENTHAMVDKHPELLELGQWLWDNADRGMRRTIKEDILSKNYPESQHANEMLSKFAGNILAMGRAGEVLNILPADQKKHWELILKEFGYEPEREDGRRLRGFDLDAARARVSAAQSQQTVSDNRTSARYSAEERRVINELFPGAIQEETRFSLIDTSEAELKDKPIKMNGMYRFKLKSAFKGVKGEESSYPYIKVQLTEVSDEYNGPAMKFDGVLEGFAEIFVPKGIITEGEKDNVFYVNPESIENELWDALRAAKNYNEFRYANGPLAESKDGYADWANVAEEVFPESIIKEHALHSAAGENRQVRGMLLYLDLLKEVLYGKDSDNSEDSNTSETKEKFSVVATPAKDVVETGMPLSVQDFARLAGNIFEYLPENMRLEVIENTFKNGFDMQSATFDLPERLALKETWSEDDRELAKIIREKVQDAMDESGVVTDRPLTTKEALWMLYQSTSTSDNSLVDAARRSVVANNLGFDVRSERIRKMADEHTRLSVVLNDSIDAATDMYNYEANLWTNRLKESWLDMNQSVIALQNALAEASGKPIEPWENLELALNQLSSKSYADKKRYLRDYLRPLWDAVIAITKASDYSINDIERYMMLKHALERNLVLAKRDAKSHYQRIYDEILNLIKSLDPAQKKTYLTNAHLQRSDAKAKLATLKAVDTTSFTEDQKRDHKQELAKAYKAVEEAEQHLFGAEKVANLTEAEVQNELDAIYKSIENGSNTYYLDLRNNDYGGLTSMFVDFDRSAVGKRSSYKSEEAYQKAVLAATKQRYDKVADMEAAAKAEVDAVENDIAGMATELWNKVNAATKEVLRHQHANGMITTEQYDAVRKMFQYYVPLRGFADNTAEDMYSYYMSNSSNGFAAPLIGAKGRKTRAESPLGWIGTMAESAIQADNKNDAKMRLYYALLNRPDTGVLSIAETWYEYTGQNDANGKKIFAPVYPPATGKAMTADELRQHMDAWEASMMQKQAAGNAFKGSQSVNLKGSVVFQDTKEQAEHIIRVKVAGKDYSILVNGNPRAAQAINGLLNPDASNSPVGEWVGNLRRYLSALMTSLSPLFWVSNYQRDLLSSFMRMSESEGWKQAFKYLGNRRKAWRVASYIYKNEKGKLGDSYYEKLYKEFAENGGITGYTSLTTNKEYEKLLEDYAKTVDKKAVQKIKNAWKNFIAFGEAIEQVSRFAAFITAKEAGKSTEEAVNTAKEVSVNFNRKGSAKPISLEELEKLRTKDGKPLNKAKKTAAIVLSAMPAGMKWAYFFFNASVQALSSSAKLAKQSPGKAAVWAELYMGLSMGLAAINYLISGDDDEEEYLDLPDYTRRSNALVKISDEYYLKWSLPQEMRPFYAIADIILSKAVGNMPHKSVGKEVALAMAEWLPVNPFGTDDPLLSLVPDFVAPSAEIMANKNFVGGKIYDDMAFRSEGEKENIPAYRKATSKTGELYVDASEILNAISGGDEVQKGWININPAMVEHLVEGYGGGLYDFAKMMVSFPAMLLSGEEIEVRDIPFVNKVALSVDETNMYSHTNEVFYYYKDIADNAERVEKEYRNSDDPSRADAYREEEDWRVHQLFEQYDAELKDLKEKLKNAADKDEEDLIKQQQNAVRKLLLNDIAKGNVADPVLEIAQDVRRIKAEANKKLRPGKDARTAANKAKKDYSISSDEFARRMDLADSLQNTEEYKRNEEIRQNALQLEKDIKLLQTKPRGEERDSLTRKLQEDYEKFTEKLQTK